MPYYSIVSMKLVQTSCNELEVYNDGTSGASGDCIKLTVTNDSNTSHYYYNKFSTASYTFQPGDYIEYDVKLLNNMAGSGGVDCKATDGTNLRDMSCWMDQNSINGHPAADITSNAYGTWYHRKLAIPSTFIGKTASYWDIAGDNNVASTTFSAIYDNIVITDGSDTERKVIFKNSSDCNINTPDLALNASAAMSITNVNGN